MNSIHYFLINVPNIILIIHEKKAFFFFFGKVNVKNRMYNTCWEENVFPFCLKIF